MKLTKSKLKEIIREEIHRLNEYGPGGDRASAISPIGPVNLKTGRSKYFNIYDTWTDSYINIFKNDKNKYVGISSAGKGSGKYTMKKHNGAFMNDQTRKFLGRWVFVEEIPIKDRDKLASKYKKFRMYAYK